MSRPRRGPDHRTAQGAAHPGWHLRDVPARGVLRLRRHPRGMGRLRTPPRGRTPICAASDRSGIGAGTSGLRGRRRHRVPVERGSGERPAHLPPPGGLPGGAEDRLDVPRPAERSSSRPPRVRIPGGEPPTGGEGGEPPEGAPEGATPVVGRLRRARAGRLRQALPSRRPRVRPPHRTAAKAETCPGPSSRHDALATPGRGIARASRCRQGPRYSRCREITARCSSTKISRIPPVMMVVASGGMLPSRVMSTFISPSTSAPTTEPST